MTLEGQHRTAGPLLDVRDLSVSLPVGRTHLHAVRNVSFSVGHADTLAIVGESGCGKSMTALALLDLLPPRAQRTAARLTLGSIDLTRCSPREMSALRGNRVAMIFQDPMTSLDPSFTIGDQLAEVLVRHKGVAYSTALAEAARALDLVRIPAASSRLGQYPHQLSGGQRQRVMIAMALICKPELVIADEPTTALDVTIQAQILTLLHELKVELSLSLVLITHDLGVVSRIADRVAVMYAGEIVEQATPSELFSAPRHPYTEGLIRCLPIPGRVERQTHLGSIRGMVPSLVGEISGCAFANRCQIVEADCRRTVIPLAGPEPEHLFRCSVRQRRDARLRDLARTA